MSQKTSTLVVMIRTEHIQASEELGKLLREVAIDNYEVDPDIAVLVDPDQTSVGAILARFYRTNQDAVKKILGGSNAQ